jgi:type II secretory pathway component PulJ
MRKKGSFTLLEVIIGVFLLGILLTALFNCFYQGIKKNITAKELKQTVLNLELFQLRLKNIFSCLEGENPLWLEKHPDASGPSLIASYKQNVDLDIDMCGSLEGMLFLNKNKQICLASWGENGKGRVEVLLDHVNSFECKLFDPEKAQWKETWTKKEEKKPVMAKIDLKWHKKKIPFVFFLSESDEKVTYPATP